MRVYLCTLVSNSYIRLPLSIPMKERYRTNEIECPKRCNGHKKEVHYPLLDSELVVFSDCVTSVKPRAARSPSSGRDDPS